MAKIPPLVLAGVCPRCAEVVEFPVEISATATRLVVEAHGERPRQAYLALSVKTGQVEHDCPDPDDDTGGDTGQDG